MPQLDKEVLRRAAMEARKAYVATLSDADRALLENALANVLTPLCADARVIGGVYAGTPRLAVT